VAEGQRFFVFFSTWVCLGTATAILIWRGSPDTKRTWFPRITLLTGVLFIGFVYWLMPAVQVLYILVPITALITVLNFKTTRFCPKCGTYSQNFGRLFRVNYCRKCGYEFSKPNADSQ